MAALLKVKKSLIPVALYQLTIVGEKKRYERCFEIQNYLSDWGMTLFLVIVFGVVFKKLKSSQTRQNG